MSLRINLNTAALTAHRMLAGTDSNLNKTIERLSSGFKINSAADDPAGLVISEKLRAQVSGLEQAIRNAGDAVNMVKTTEGALNEVSSLLRSMRDLAVHAANTGANDSAAVAADQSQIVNALASIDKIAEETQFGNKKLLDGSAGVKATITGAQITGMDLSKGTLDLVDGDTLTITKTQSATRATLNTDSLAANDTTAIAADIDVTIGGHDYSFVGGTDTATTIVAAINANTSTTGVFASLAAGNTGVVTLTSIGYGSAANLQVLDADAGFLVADASSAAAVGQDVRATVANSSGDPISDATWTSGTGCNLMDTNGNIIALTTAAAATDPNLLTTAVAITKGSLTFQVGAYAGQIREISLGSLATTGIGLGAVTGMTLASINVNTNAQDSLTVIDQAIKDISSLRANLGATQKNVFESSINSLTIAQENIASSESTIRDTDMASEVVNLTRFQILQQAGTAMLAQANQTPQTLLKLLQ